jgi:glycosyltransferase involved in cell wall biosynthesis
MSRILVFVPNTATTDRRVIRQSNSLAKNGHDVEIVGITTATKFEKNVLIDESILVTRVNWRAETYRILFLLSLKSYAKLILILSFFLLLAVFLTAVPFYNSFNLMFNEGVNIFSYNFNSNVVYLFVVTFFLILFIASYFFTRKIFFTSSAFNSLKKAKNVASNYAKIEKEYHDSTIVRLLGKIFSIRNKNNDNTFKATIYSRANAMLKYGREWKPDIVYCHEVATLGVGAKLKNELGCKLIYDAHEIYDDLANATPVQTNTYKNMHFKYLKYVDHFITVNPRVLSYYTENYPEISECTVMPNTVFPDLTDKYDNRLHIKAGLSADTKIILYQGGFGKHRGLEKLIDASKDFPDNWRLVMMGWGNLKEKLIEQSDNNKKDFIQEYSEVLFKEMMCSAEFVKKMDKMQYLPISDNHAKVNDSDFINLLLRRDNKHIEELSKSIDVPEKEENKLDNLINEVNFEVHKKIKSLESQGYFDKVIFIPPAPHDELVMWSKGADIGVIPYENIGANHWNCSPNKIWEYANAGTPILASRMLYINELISKYKIGWTFVTDFTAKDISNAISKITTKDINLKSRNCKKFIKLDNYYHYEEKLLNIFKFSNK